MLKKTLTKMIVYLLLINLAAITIIPINSSASSITLWDTTWSYNQELDIPFDTSLELAKFQPIDIRFEFDNNCWAKNENDHSIRVCCWDGNRWYELESQIYDLEKIDEYNIKACSLVFLIPEFADGNERYFVYYDESEKPSPDYIDHVEIENSYYRYEPISGYPLESDFFKIIDDTYVQYGVAYDGQFMGYNTCQHVTKMKDNITEILPKNGHLFLAFDFKYAYGKGLFDYSSTSQKLISKEIITDGDLMLEFGIISQSKFNELQTTATYKYYHCPASTTRIHAHIKHEALEEIKVYNAVMEDGIFASFQCGSVRSNSIEELNIGDMQPFMHFSNEMKGITQFPIDLDPDYIPENPYIRIVKIQDDVDLGNNNWISLDEGEKGLSHAVIFNSDSVIKRGDNERDGLQINAYEIDYPHFPGLENNMGTIQIGRNSIEKGSVHDDLIPGDFVAEFDAEFFTSNSGGYAVIDEEAEIFQELVKIKPSYNGDFDGDTETLKKHSLKVAVHLSPSAPMGSGLSTLLGINFSYINVELYKNNEFKRSGTAGRIPMKTILNFDELQPFEQIIAILRSFDLKNFTFFKTVTFQNLEPGEYVIKIYKENLPISKNRRFIGFVVVNLEKDTETHVFYHPEGSVNVELFDQNNKGVEKAEVLLLKEGAVIANSLTDKNGQTVIKAPRIFEPYDLQVLYNDITVFEKPIKIKKLGQILSITESINIQRYRFNLKVSDTWQLTPEIELDPVLIFQEEDKQIILHAEKNNKNNFIFTNLTPNSYQLNLKYKSFTLEKNIEIRDNDELDLVFPAEFKTHLKILDSKGNPCNNAKIILTRENKKLELKNCESETTLTIPPGIYRVEIYDNGDLISVRNIDIFSERNFDLITDYEPFFYTLILFVGICLVVAFLILFIVKKIKKQHLIFIPIILLTLSFLFPWWAINGSSSQLETNTNMFIMPTELITITKTPDVISGELAFLPDIFIDAMNVILVFTAIGCIIFLSSWYFKKHNKKRLYFFSLALSILAFIGSIGIFTYGMSEFCNVGVGSFIGSGNLDIGIPGESSSISVLSNWGPSMGFYLYIVAIVVFILYILLNRSKKFEKRI